MLVRASKQPARKRRGSPRSPRASDARHGLTGQAARWPRQRPQPQCRRGVAPGWRAVILASVCGLAAGCGETAPAVDAPPRAVTAVAAERLAPVSVAPALEVSGVVESRTRIELAFRVTGFVERFHVDEGDRVETGDLLAELDQSDLRHEHRAVRAAAERAAAQAADAARTLARQQELFAHDSTSQQSLDRARSQSEMTRAEAAEARVRVAMAEDKLAKAVLRAPIAGAIEARLIDPHELATAQKPVLVLTELDPLVVRASVADQQLGALALGASARVTTPLWPGREFSGSLVRMGVAADPSTRTVPFEVEIANPDGALRPELAVQVSVPLGEPQEKLLVPLSAVLRDADRTPFCFVVDEVEAGAVAARRRVELGALHEGRVAVVGGLAPGSRIITRGQHFLRTGDPVRVVEE